MIWGFFRRRDLRSAAERFRAEHSRFLSSAMMSGRRYPTIPTRRVRDGGFDAMMSRPTGPDRAERWWSAAMSRMDE